MPGSARGARSEQAEVLLRHHRRWAAPPLWRSAFRNLLTGYLRRDLLPFPKAEALLQEAEAILTAFPDVAQSLHQVTS